MSANIFTAGPARALFFMGDQLIGVGKTLSDTTFTSAITAEEIRGGQGNMLWGQYFHDSSLTISITDCMFNIRYVAANLGVDVAKGGVTVYESGAAGESVVTPGQIVLTNTPVAFDGALIGWYKKPTDENWSVATITNNVMSVPGALVGQSYCVKYFYQNENADSLTIKAQFTPKVLHLVLINDLYSGSASDVAASTSKYGRLITDIPVFQLDGAVNLAWASASAATVPLNGKALAYDDSNSCEEDPVYGTMTQEIFGAKWQDEVVALAIENADIDLSNGESENLIVRAVFGGNVASQRKDASNFTFAVEAGSTSIVEVDNTGKVTAKGAGTGYVTVTLKGHPEIQAVAAITVAD